MSVLLRLIFGRDSRGCLSTRPTAIAPMPPYMTRVAVGPERLPILLGLAASLSY